MPSMKRDQKTYWFLRKRFIALNVLALIAIKLALSPLTFQLGALLDNIPGFNSRTIIEYTNEARKSNNLPALEANYKLDQAAQEKLEDMIQNKYFAHVSPQGTTPWVWIKNTEYQYSFAGENLAVGFLTPNETVEAWMKSSSHRANILNDKYQEIGVAVGYLETETATGVLVVQMFGRPKTGSIQPQVAGAKPVVSPLLTPTPVIKLPAQVKPTPQSTVASLETKTPPTKLQYIAVQESDKPVGQPVSPTKPISSDSRVNQWLSSLNSWFMLYTLLTVAGIVIFGIIAGDSRRVLPRAVLHGAVAIAAALIPVAQFSIQGIIF